MFDPTPTSTYRKQRCWLGDSSANLPIISSQKADITPPHCAVLMSTAEISHRGKSNSSPKI